MSLPILLIILDGAGDRQQPGLGGLTPFEAAKTPALDALAGASACGQMWPMGPGSAPTSPLAHFTLFGYRPDEFPGRGLIESLGEGMAPAPGEVVCRVNFATCEPRDGWLWVARRPDPRQGEPTNADVDLDAVLLGVECRFVHTGAAQGLLFLRAVDGLALSAAVTDADPLCEDSFIRAVEPFAEAHDGKASRRTANVLNAWMLEARARLAGKVLDTAIVKWPASLASSLPPFEARTGLRGATVARGPIYRGLASVIGLETPGLEDSNDLAADLHADLDAALEMLDQGFDFVHVHSKWPDMAGHRKFPERKREVLELLDASLAPYVDRLLDERIVVCVTTDHQTPCSGPLYHSGGAVPLMISGGAAGRDAVGEFGERACREGLLGHLRGWELMPLLLDCAERSAFLGAERYTAEKCLGTARDTQIVRLADGGPGV